jgi:hypothetical protein
MKTVSVFLIDKLKAIFYSFGPSGEFIHFQDKYPGSLQKKAPEAEPATIKKEKTDLVLL